jgi:hypothetical protein
VEQLSSRWVPGTARVPSHFLLFNCPLLYFLRAKPAALGESPSTALTSTLLSAGRAGSGAGTLRQSSGPAGEQETGKIHFGLRHFSIYILHFSIFTQFDDARERSEK